MVLQPSHQSSARSTLYDCSLSDASCLTTFANLPHKDVSRQVCRNARRQNMEDHCFIYLSLEARFPSPDWLEQRKMLVVALLHHRRACSDTVRQLVQPTYANTWCDAATIQLASLTRALDRSPPARLLQLLHYKRTQTIKARITQAFRRFQELCNPNPRRS